MTDRSPTDDDARLHTELTAWFEGEVRQAELDLRRAPLRPARARRGPARGIAAPAAGAILVVVLVIAGVSRLPSLAGPATEPTGSTIPSSSVPASAPSDSATPAATGVITGRYGDGIPMDIDGEPVLRITSLDLAPTDDTPFLVGAWTIDWKDVRMSCLPVPGTPPPFLPRCNVRWLSDAPANRGDAVLGLYSWTPLSAGPVVVKVHRHDDRAGLCDAATREACEALAVVEDTQWTGDVVTAAEPISPVEAIQRLEGALPGSIREISMLWGPAGPPRPGLGLGEAIGQCLPPYPQLSWTVWGASSIRSILVFPSVAARERVDQDLTPTGFNGPTETGEDCSIRVIYDFTPYETEWIAVENVMVAIDVEVGVSDPGLPLLRKAISEALEGRGL
ncbi:MAG: hypothetical protein L0227_01730 [Chloroflexi bacterium]|nr:hypothetical protein [Chloroflexota bacterium]